MTLFVSITSWVRLVPGETVLYQDKEAAPPLHLALKGIINGDIVVQQIIYFSKPYLERLRFLVKVET